MEKSLSVKDAVVEELRMRENMKKDVTDIKCRVVFKDTGFYGENGDEVKSNSILILKQYGIDNVVTV